MRLEWRKSDGVDPQRRQRIAELDAAIRNWPRRSENDPYREGLERVTQVLAGLIPQARVMAAYNEFCRPSLTEAIAQVVAEGARRVFVIPSMLTPGGLHSEQDVPQELARARAAHPNTTITYVWPFETASIASLLAEHVRRAMTESSSDRRRPEPAAPMP
jgi:sirohydrochlorin cobaltochelatase